MDEDSRLAKLGERVAALEAENKHTHALAERTMRRMDETRRELVDTAAAAGRQGAISYEEGLRASFIASTRDDLDSLAKNLARLWYAVIGLICTVLAMGTVIGVKLQVLVPP